MPKLELTPSCLAAVAASAILPFKDTSVPLPNGNREIWVEEDTYDRLVEVQFPGETLSDTVERLLVADRGPLS